MKIIGYFCLFKILTTLNGNFMDYVAFKLNERKMEILKRFVRQSKKCNCRMVSAAKNASCRLSIRVILIIVIITLSSSYCTNINFINIKNIAVEVPKKSVRR